MIDTLVIGGTGVIGYKIIESLKENNQNVEFTYFKNSVVNLEGHHLNIIDKDCTISLIKKLKPKIIINASSFTNMDLCERHKEIAYSTNVKGLENIIEAAKICESKIIHISTSAVFSGKKDIYKEEDKHDPISYYGITKSISEKILLASDVPHLIVRTDQPYCWVQKWQHENSVIRTIQTLNKNIQLNEITDWFNTPTYVPDFVNAIKSLISKNEEGIIHVVGSDYISRYEYSLLVCEIFKLNKKLVQPILSNVLKLSAKRSNVKLNNDKLIKKIGLKMKNVKEGLEMMKSEFNLIN